MSTPQWPSKVTPAQLAFLAIYNPSLGPTDDTFRDQIVFYYSRAAHDARIAAKKNARSDAAGGDALRAEENEKLRQVGLAQGMVDFAKTFSAGEAVDSIETEKSRIGLHELERGWWILASVDLTRLPSISPSSTEQAKKPESKPNVEYSSREVSPPALLVQQLLQAHYIFCLHHGPSLNDLFVRLTRDKFCTTLDRFWTRFARSWDVLLHGNPAADIFSGVKLASGGELGFGVGEEEWGSGEREVLEDLSRRTEGLVDVVVSRFGEPSSTEEKDLTYSDETLPWMGAGNQPIASDGVIFGGIGAIQRHSVRDISLWMRQIYTYGEHAYGVKDNPLRERRKRARRDLSDQPKAANGNSRHARTKDRKPDEPKTDKATVENQVADGEGATSDTNQLLSPPDERPGLQPRAASHGSATTPEDPSTPLVEEPPPNIPPPIVPIQEQNSRDTTTQAAKPIKPANEQDDEAADEANTTLGIPDQYMKYLTFGLSALAKPKRPSVSRRTSAASSKVPPTQNKDTPKKIPKTTEVVPEEEEPQSMKQVEPIPDGEKLKSKLAIQKRQENRGHFVIGLKGDLLELDELSEDDEQTEGSESSLGVDNNGSRIVLRTIQVEVVSQADNDSHPDETISRKPSSAGNEDTTNKYRRLRVLLYVHRPFMYCFLFENRTGSLQWTKFYKSLHRNLVPIHKPLLSSTSVAKVAQRIENSQVLATSNDDASVLSQETGRSKSPSSKAAANSSPIYELIYDPRRLTLHTSIPNIPEPGTPAAEGLSPNSKNAGIAAPSSWTRIEALNVHSQILNTLTSVKTRPSELERTSKTNRGWWVVWMKIPSYITFPSSNDNENEEEGDDGKGKSKAGSSVQTLHSQEPGAKSDAAERRSEAGGEEEVSRIAFLVRKASDIAAAPKKASNSSSSSRAVSSMLEVMSLGMAGRDDDSGSERQSPAALTGGIGIDARTYIEGLLSLNR